MEYKNPAVTADVLIIRGEEILLAKRKEEPFKGKWCIPGGHINYSIETIEECAIREIREETGLIIKKEYLKLEGVFSEPNRDPRSHHITIVFSTKYYSGNIYAGTDAEEVLWFKIKQLPDMAFDHNKVIKCILAK